MERPYRELLNAPNWLKSVRAGAAVRVPFSHLEDWMMTFQGQAYGGFTVNAMRAKMDPRERKEHDNAWGLDFGDPAVVHMEIERQEKPKKSFISKLFGGGKESPPPSGKGAFRDHPMCVNMLASLEQNLKADPAFSHSTDAEGWNLLQREALAGNLGVVKVLVRHDAVVTAKTPQGRTASELARGIGWPEIADYLDQCAAGGKA